MQKKQVLIDNRWAGETGIGRLYKEVIKLKPEEVDCSFVSNKMGLGSLFSPLMLANEIRKTRADTFYSPSFMPPLYSSVPFIFTVHDLMHLFYYSSLHRIYYQQIIARLAKKAKRIITVSHFSKQQLVELMGIKEELISVIYNGVDESFLLNTEQYPADRPYLLYVGNRRKNKNIPAMLIAFAQAKIPDDFIFLLTGNPDPDLSAQISDLKITNRVRFLGFVDEAELPKLYKGAHATLFVSLMEGFGLPLLESMASGTPVLTSKESSLPEIAGNAALCVNPFDVEEIAEGIERLVNDKILYKEFVEKGYQRAKDFPWKATAKETWQIILS
ncbi:MAG: glycosyltransferase family 1 protein [Anditalea sp.]